MRYLGDPRDYTEDIEDIEDIEDCEGNQFVIRVVPRRSVAFSLTKLGE